MTTDAATSRRPAAREVLAMVPWRFSLERGDDRTCVLEVFVDSGLVGWDVAFAVTEAQAAGLAADDARPLLLRDAIHPHLADRRAMPAEIFPPDRFAILCDVAAFDPLEWVGPQLVEALSLFLSHQSGSLRDEDGWPIATSSPFWQMPGPTAPARAAGSESWMTEDLCGIVRDPCRVERCRDGSHAFAMLLVRGRTGREVRVPLEARQARASVDEPDCALRLRETWAGPLREGTNPAAGPVSTRTASRLCAIAVSAPLGTLSARLAKAVALPEARL